MGMGYAAAFANVVDENVVKDICPDEFERFESLLKEEAEGVDCTIGQIAISLDFGDVDDLSEELVKAYEILCGKFEQETDLSLGIGYHNSQEQGSRYDEVSGLFWWIDGVFILSEAAKRFKGAGYDFTVRNYVQFG